MSRLSATLSSSSIQPWRSRNHSKRTGADKNSLDLVADGPSREDRDKPFMDRPGDLTLYGPNAQKQDIMAEPDTATSSVTAALRGKLRVGIWRGSDRHQKKPSMEDKGDGFTLRDRATRVGKMDEREDVEGISRRWDLKEATMEEHRIGVPQRQREREERQATWREDAARVEKYAVHDEASLVTCAAGLDIWHVVTGFDLCEMTIQNLPRNSKESDIADILAERNVPFPVFLITRKHTSSDTSEATILIAKEVGSTLALELDGLLFQNQVLHIEADNHSTRHAMPQMEGSSPYLTVSWRGQTDTLIASYPSNEEAVARAKGLDGMLWKGQRLAVSLNQHHQGSSSTKSVKITRYPTDATSDPEFLDFIGTRFYRVLKTKPYNHQCTLIMVRIHLRQQRGVRMDTYEEITSSDDVDETRVTVHFNNWEDVEHAYGTFHRKKLGTGEETTPTLRASHPKPFQFSIKISRRQFQAQEKQWETLKETKQGKQAHLLISQYGDTAFIYVLGSDLRTTGALKVRVEKLAAGEALDTSNWHPYFANSSTRFFKRVHAETGVHIRIETKMQSLKIFGERDKVAHASTLIKAEVQRLRRMETTGNDKGDENHEEAFGSHMVDEQVCEWEGDDPLGSFPEDRSAPWKVCVVCYCEASAPEHLGCGHVYCEECLRHHLGSAADTRVFPITCIGNDATCDTPLPLPVIRRFMDNQAFQHLVEVAFTCYLELHPEEYRHCVTPDCKQIYRPQRSWQCPSCFFKICPACEEESHEGLTCEERRLRRDPALLEQLKQSLGYRKCPKCSAWIEKAGGCNHVTCKCGGHICWRCMGHFSVGEIYKHLSKARCKFYKPLPPKPIIVSRPAVSIRPDGCPDISSQRQHDVERYGAREWRRRIGDQERCLIM